MDALVGRYTVEKVLGEGGMAEVFLARLNGPQGFARRFVLKKLLPNRSADPALREMLLREARVSSLFTHPNLVPAIELIESSSGEYIIVLEYLEGWSLHHLIHAAISRETVLGLHLATYVAFQVAKGLAYAHGLRGPDGESLHLVHRDVTPSNIFVTTDGVPKLIDFGIAKITKKRTTGSLVKGKPLYLSPEQARAEDDLDGRTDLFALGCVFYELLTGMTFFSPSSALEMIIHTGKLTKDEVDTQLAYVNAPSETKAVLERMLAPKRQDRFESAEELAHTLETLLISSGRVDYSNELQKFCTELLERSTVLHSGQPLSGEALDTRILEMQALLSESQSQVIEGRHKPESVDADASSPQTPSRGETRPTEGIVEPGRRSARRALALSALGMVLIAALVFSIDADLLDRWVEGSATESSRAEELTQAPGTEPVEDATEEVESASTATTPNTEAPAEEATVAPSALAEAEHQEAPKPDAKGAADSEQQPLKVVAGANEGEGNNEGEGVDEGEGIDETSETVTVDESAPREEVGDDPAVTRRVRKRRVQRVGSLELSSDPPLWVFFQGRSLGETPLKGVKLPPGQHVLRLANRAAHVERTVKVTVRAGETTLKRITLEKGSLAVRATPWAEVYLEGRRLGTTPMAPFELYEGKYTLVFKNPTTGKTKSARVTIESGKQEVFNVDLH